MIKKIRKKRWLVFASTLILFSGVILGTLNLVKNAKRAVEDLDYETYVQFTDSVSHTIGFIRDTNGELLWSQEFQGYPDTYSVVGELKNKLTENTLALANSDNLMNPSEYSIWKGASSLEDSGQNLTLTLDHRLNLKIYEYMEEELGIKSGSALFMDTRTGAIRTAVSLPGMKFEFPITALPEGALLNKNLRTTTPGSTMKIVSLVLLNAIAPEELERAQVECKGSYSVSGGEIICGTQQGNHDIQSALGVSCNCFFAKEITEILDPSYKEVCELLYRMGIHISSQKSGSTEELDAGIQKKISSVDYLGNGEFSSTWSLIGQGQTQVCPIDMCRVISAIAEDGLAPNPHFIETKKQRREQLLEEKNSEEVLAIWKEGYEKYYSSQKYNSHISAAKTGTAELGNGRTNKLLAGYIQEKHLAFYIVVEDFNNNQIDPAKIANHACEYLFSE